jgi:flavin-dependent dehydrogenase
VLKRSQIGNGGMDQHPVVVCGSGAAGLAASLAAARAGADVRLLEKCSRVGGTVANALIHTLGGLYDSAGEILNEGLPRELVDRLLQADPSTRRRKMGRTWVLQVCPNVYRDVIEQWIGEQRKIKVFCRARAANVVLSDEQIVDLQVAIEGDAFHVRPRAVIDATGTAEVVRLLDESLVVDDDRRSAGGLIVRMRSVSPGALDFPKGLGIVRALRAAAASGSLPSECAHAWIDVGIHADEAFVKLLVPLDDWRDALGMGVMQERAETMQAAVIRFLRGLPEFAHAAVTQTGCLGVRDGGRIRGRYTLSVDDVRRARTFADGVCRCAWPIEYWDAERGVSIEYLPDGACYEIPMRSLQLNGLENFWAVGKCLSADRYAHASARVVGACWAMGQAAGIAAAAGEARYGEQECHHESLRPVSTNGVASAGVSGDRWSATTA